MRHFLARSACILALSSPSLVYAEAGATEILDEIFGMYQSEEIELIVGEVEDKRGYTEWRDVSIASKDSKVVFNLPWVRVTNKLIGGHEMTMADQSSMTVAGDLASGFPGMKVDFGMVGFTSDIKGSKGAREFVGSTEQVTIKTNGAEGPLSIDAVLNNLTYTQSFLSGTGSPRIKSDASIESLSAEYSFSDGRQTMTTKGTAGKMTTSTDMVIPKSLSPDAALSLEPFSFAYTMADGDFVTSGGTPEGPVNIAAKFADSGMAVTMSEEAFDMSGHSVSVDYTLNMAAAGLPPIEASIDRFDMAMGAPLNNQGEAKDAKLKMLFNNLTLSESVWGMFDPEKVVPREPAVLDISLSGAMKWLGSFDEFDPTNPPEQMPVQFETAKVEALNLKLGGAELVSSGDFTLDNSQIVPRAVGSLDASLLGGQTLLRKLVDIGLLEEAQAMAAIGMAMVFAQPGDQGDDHLVTTIEMSEDGGIKANGIKLK